MIRFAALARARDDLPEDEAKALARLELTAWDLVVSRWEKQMTTKQIFEAALSLPDESKATLAERLVAHLASHVEPEVERAQLDAATRRRDEILSGKVQALDGEAVMARARQIVDG